MSICDKSEKALDALSVIGVAVEELKGIVESTTQDEESPDADGIKAITKCAYDRLRSGVAMVGDGTGTRQFPSESWFCEVVKNALRQDARACRAIAIKFGAQQTEKEINCRLEKSRSF